MIRFGKWHTQKTNQPLAAVRVTHYLTREDLECLLIYRVEPHKQDKLKDLSARQTEKVIREQLESSYEAAMYWSDSYHEVYDDDDVSEEQVSEWAKRQVARMLGEI